MLNIYSLTAAGMVGLFTIKEIQNSNHIAAMKKKMEQME